MTRIVTSHHHHINKWKGCLNFGSMFGFFNNSVNNVEMLCYWYVNRLSLLQREFGDECVFNETIEQTNYNTYSSTKYSNEKRTFYLALNRRGQPRKVVVRARNQLGRLSSYTRVLTRNVAPELQLHPMRHHGHVCPSPVSHQSQKAHPESPRCRKKKKRKKKKRKCPDDELDHDLCQKRQGVANKHKVQNRNSHKCDNEKDSDMCQRDVNNKKKVRLDVSDKHLVSVPKKKKKNRKGVRKRLEDRILSQETTTTTLAPTSTTPPEDLAPDEDYGVDSSTHSDWEDSTAIPDVSMAVSDAKLAAPHIDSDWLLSPSFYLFYYLLYVIVHKYLKVNIPHHWQRLFFSLTQTLTQNRQCFPNKDVMLISKNHY